jgi:SAM-dependent methyltransferase
MKPLSELKLQTKERWDAVYRTAKLKKPCIEVIKVGKILQKDACILDVGSGTGNHAIPLAKQGHSVYAVDLSGTTELLWRVKEHGVNHKVYVVNADMEEERLYDGSKYDFVIASGSIMNLVRETSHFPRMEKMLKRFKKATKKGGYNYVSIPTQIEWVDSPAGYSSEGKKASELRMIFKTYKRQERRVPFPFCRKHQVVKMLKRAYSPYKGWNIQKIVLPSVFSVYSMRPNAIHRSFVIRMVAKRIK